MQADLDTAIRDALHDHEITDDDLRYRELRSTASRRFGGFAAAATVVACVAAVAAVVAAVNWPVDHNTGGGTHQVAGQLGFADVLGYQWRVTGLIDAQGALSVPDAHGAMIGYTHHGFVAGNDSVNSIGGHYEAVAGGYAVSDAATTLVGYAGDDLDRKRMIAAVDAMFFAESSPPQPHVIQVTVSSDGDTLTLVSGDTTLTLARDGEQPELSDMASASPSPTK